MEHHHKMRYILLGGLLAGGTLFCFLSWRADPDLGTLSWMPNWIAEWTDIVENSNKRTAIPMFFLACFSGSLLFNYGKTAPVKWLAVFFLLNGFVVLVELCQELLPKRTPDFLDVVWGAIGSTLGLTFALLLKYRLTKKHDQST